MDNEMFDMFRLFDNGYLIMTYGLLIIGTIWLVAGEGLIGLFGGMIFILMSVISLVTGHNKKTAILNRMQRKLNRDMMKLIKEEAWKEAWKDMKKETKRNTTKQRKR